MGKAKFRWGPEHANSNVICAMDIRVGGPDPDMSDLLEIAILPMSSTYKMHPEFKLFSIKVRPCWPVDNRYSRVSQESLDADYKTSPFDSVGALRVFETWVEETLQLGKHKKIMP